MEMVFEVRPAGVATYSITIFNRFLAVESGDMTLATDPDGSVISRRGRVPRRIRCTERDRYETTWIQEKVLHRQIRICVTVGTVTN